MKSAMKHPTIVRVDFERRRCACCANVEQLYVVDGVQDCPCVCFSCAMEQFGFAREPARGPREDGMQSNWAPTAGRSH